MKKVLVFGDFDILHPGHLHFLRRASRGTSLLVVAVTRAAVVKKLKKRLPLHSDRERLAAIRRIPYVTQAILGDKTLRSFKVIQRIRPSLICIGYDQNALANEIRSYCLAARLHIPMRTISAHRPDIYKSSAIRKLITKK